MSRIDELIQQLCPDGVEYKPLEKITYYSSERVAASTLTSQNYIGVDNLLPNKKGKTISEYVPSNGNFIKYRRNNILIGNIRPYLKKIWLATHDGGSNGDVLVICIEKEYELQIIPDFLYYLLSSDSFFYYAMQYAKGAKMPRGNKNIIMEYQVPVPPLPVQEEIVRILDKFTLLEAELEAELEARRKQYEYYRDQLLTFGDEVAWKPLGAVGRICMCKRIMKNETSLSGEIPFYKIGTFGKKADSFISRELFNRYKRKYSFPSKGTVLISASGTIGRTVIYNGEDAYFQDSNIVWVDNDETIVLNKFLFYFYKIVKWKTEGGTIARLYNDNLSRIPVPIPPLAEQERIVAILDKFDALVNDISTGLPAELEMRRKQYEYYRDKLLTFKPIAKEA